MIHKQKILDGNALVLGVCYYPEHWPEEIWADDLDRMLECGIQVVRIAEFSWNLTEPASAANKLSEAEANTPQLAAGKLTGNFTCSDERVNQLWHNVQWGMRSNFLDIPTDCPQRDERLGWIGDAQIFAPTASFHMNTALFYEKWLHDLMAEQTKESGTISKSKYKFPCFMLPLMIIGQEAAFS